MTLQEAAFALQQSRYLLKEYVEMIDEFGLDDEKVYDRVDGRMAVQDSEVEPSTMETCQDERREQEGPTAR
jgi:hypothetical protein